jgi:DNA-binding HxlR family transcriptional regulator
MDPSSFRIERSPVVVAAHVLGRRWAAHILWSLFWEGKSFYQLLRDADGLSRGTLVEELEVLQRFGLVAHVRARSGPRLQYVLTPLGESAKPALAALYEWGLLARDFPWAQRPAGGGPLEAGIFQAAVDAGARRPEAPSVGDGAGPLLTEPVR